jgi:alpha-tubulin suppressor-like RCC1 family protein
LTAASVWHSLFLIIDMGPTSSFNRTPDPLPVVSPRIRRASKQAARRRVIALGWLLIGCGTNSSTAPTPRTFSVVSAGEVHTCAITSAGAAYCWGSGESGELGDADSARRTTPVAVSGGLTFTAVSAGTGHTCGVTRAAAVYCWGFNLFGELGTGTTTSSTTPAPVSGGLTFVWVRARATQTCGITSAGAAYCWGLNQDGELGTDSATNSTTPAPVSGGLTFAVVSPGTQHTCGVTTVGAAYCWGENSSGQLGTGTTTNSPTPAAVAGGLTFTTVSSADAHTCGLTPAGDAYCWGWSHYGQLGNGTTTGPDTCPIAGPCSLAPIAVLGGLTFASVSAGSANTCGVTMAGAAYCWGFNAFGQLGNGTTQDSAIPVAVSGGLSFASLSVGGGTFTCGVTTAGAVYCWGDNDAGQLGTGTSGGTSLVPVRVLQ